MNEQDGYNRWLDREIGFKPELTVTTNREQRRRLLRKIGKFTGVNGRPVWTPRRKKEDGSNSK